MDPPPPLEVLEVLSDASSDEEPNENAEETVTGVTETPPTLTIGAVLQELPKVKCGKQCI